MLATLTLGAAATAITCSTPGLLPLLGTFAAGLAGNISGNLATDVFHDFDRAAAERWFDRFGATDENHVVLEQLRLRICVP